MFLLIFFFTLIFVFLFFFVHESGHYITGKICNYQPSALVMNFCIFPSSVPLLEDFEKVKTICKFSGLIFQILFVFLSAILLFGFHLWRSWFFWLPFLIFSIIVSLDDIRLALEDFCDKEKLFFLTRTTKVAKLEEIFPTCALVTSREKWRKWKEKYPSSYEKFIDKEIFLP